jgi:hypothetical protein
MPRLRGQEPAREVADDRAPAGLGRELPAAEIGHAERRPSPAVGAAFTAQERGPSGVRRRQDLVHAAHLPESAENPGAVGGYIKGERIMGIQDCVLGKRAGVAEALGDHHARGPRLPQAPGCAPATTRRRAYRPDAARPASRGVTTSGVRASSSNAPARSAARVSASATAQTLSAFMEVTVHEKPLLLNPGAPGVQWYYGDGIGRRSTCPA